MRGGPRATDASIPAALAVLAEIGRATGPGGDAGEAPFIRYSVRDVEGATRFSRSTVSMALTALERVGLIAVDTPRRPSPATPADAPSMTSDAAHQAPAAVYVGEFAGTPIFAPPGTPLIVECGSDGRWTCRVGPLLRLGRSIRSRTDKERGRRRHTAAGGGLMLDLSYESARWAASTAGFTTAVAGRGHGGQDVSAAGATATSPPALAREQPLRAWR